MFPRTASLLCSLLLLIGSLSACAQESPIHVVEMTAPDEEALSLLLNSEFNVGNRRGNTVTFYVNDEELAALAKQPYPWEIIETQSGASSPEKAIGYTKYEELGPKLQSYASAYSDLVRVISLGQTPQYREIYAVKITTNPDMAMDKAVVKYIAAIHGDETVGVEMCLYFIEDLLQNYGKHPFITNLINDTVIWVVPMMNPDGHAAVSRYSAGKDLNRNFPIFGIHYHSTFFDGENLGDDKVPPENRHIMRWHEREPANLAANFHGGALVANYPYDNDPGVYSPQPAISPDDDVFQYLSLEYSRNNPPMYTDGLYPQGIVNGSVWYSITGGMMDWHYRFLGCPEVTLEISKNKIPPVSTLPLFWDQNRDSMYAYLNVVHMGIRGVVKDRRTGGAVWAKVLVDDREQPVFTNRAVGNYHRMLLPGRYNLSFHSSDHITYHVDDILVEEGGASRVDVTLSRGDVNSDGRVDAADIQAVVDVSLGRSDAYDADVDGRGVSATDIQAVINAVADAS
ncbi:MAG: hypothetical protein GX130_03100 [Candidatus Hydrogenedens sp.]|nr:hypothetical protein [Candidatus Hydrogenedens sp.]